MRKIFVSLAFIATLTTTLFSCKKVETYGSFDSMTVGAYVTLVSKGNSILDYGNLATTSADITVREFGSPISSIIIYATEGAANLNRTAWKKVKEVPLSGDTKLVVTATELAAGLGIAPTALKTGTQYTFYNQLVLKDGRIFDPANTNSSFQGISDYNMAMTWNAIVVCPFSSTGFAGNFRVLEDGWADWSPGDVVQVTAATATSVTLNVYPNPAAGGINAKLITVTVNASTGAASISTAQSYGGYAGFDPDIKVKTVGTNNWVFSCTGTITLRLNHTGLANWGDYNIRLQKL
ncbi:MAG: hypothetical protein K2P88_02485 [Chitinophagaceae bacterium]|nr:hypothetical protein [Chitinophagaceae bacterium]